MTTSKVTKAVDSFPDLMVSQGGKNVFNQNQEEDEASLPESPTKKGRHVPPATGPLSSPPLSTTLAIPLGPPENSCRSSILSKIAVLRSTADAGQSLGASFGQAVPSSPTAASGETPLLCRDDRCNQLRSPVFKNVTYAVDVDSSECDSSSNGAFVIIRWMCYHCDTTSSERVHP